MAKFRKGTRESLKKHQKEKHKKHVRLPGRIIKAGRFLSPKAFRIYAIIDWFNPSYPSYMTLRLYSGYAKEALSNALSELELKKMIERTSGRRHRESNIYCPRPVEEWDLLKAISRPSDKHKLRKRKKLLSQLLWCIQESALRKIEFDNRTSSEFDNRTSTVSIIEPETGSIIEKEPDQSQSRSINQEEGASRQKGVGPPADDIRKPGLAKLHEQLDALDRFQAEKKKSVGRSSTCKIDARV